MTKRSARRGKASPPHDEYDLPGEVDFSKTTFLGVGLDALERQATGRKATVELDADVAQVFTNSKAVNNVLRAFIANARVPAGTVGKRRKTA